MKKTSGEKFCFSSTIKRYGLSAAMGVIATFSFLQVSPAVAESDTRNSLDQQLVEALHGGGFTGNIQSTLEARLGRPIDRKLADLGRSLFFDTLTGLHDDNS